MPDSPETRIGRLERETSALQQQVKDLAHDVEALLPVQMSVARIETTIAQVDREISGLKVVIAENRAAAQASGDEMTQEMKAMRDEAMAQSKANRTQLIAAAVSIITTLLLVAGTIVAAA